MQKILVIQTAFIGDVVLATSILEELHAALPDAELHFMVRKGNEGLLNGHPYLHKTWVWNKQKNKLGNLRRMRKAVRREKFDIVVNVQRFFATGFLTAFSGAKQKIGYNKNPLSFLFTKRVPHVISTPEHPIHEIDRCHELIKDITGVSHAFKPRLYPTPEDYEKVKPYKDAPYVCIAPASVWFTKQYPPAQWAALLIRLPSNLQAYLLGSPADQRLCDEIIRLTPGAKAQSLAGKLSLLQSAALQQDAKMNYVNDSAPMHFASAVNAPVTAVYCSTIPAFGFGPVSDKSFIVEVQEKLDCRPCGLHGKRECPLGHFHCAKWIKDEQLLETLK